MKVDFYRHGLSPADADAVANVLGTPILTSGPVAREVEAQLRNFFDLPHALLTNSWTNGAIATLLALEIGEGDEVIVPAMTFIASANVVELVGAKPVFVDVDPQTLLMTPEAVARALTERTRAVIPVHLYGQMVDMAGIRQALGGRPIAIVEDAAHCFEGTRDGDAPGTHSDAAIFSFYATKNVACGEGGAIVTRRDDLAERLRMTRLHGMSAGAADRYKKGSYRHWDMEVLGVKANLPDLLAALLPAQVERVREVRERRQSVANRYLAGLKDLPVQLPAIEAGVLHAWHLCTMGVELGWRDAAIGALNARQIGVAVNYRSVPTLTWYRNKYGYRPEDFPVSWDWGERTITLPTYPSLRPEEQEAVISAIREDVVSLWT